MSGRGAWSGWWLAGLGCGMPLVLLAIVVALFATGVRTARRSDGMADADLQHALTVLGVDALPEGYELYFLGAWPLFADAVALAGSDPPARGPFFLYVQSWSNRIWERLDGEAIEFTAEHRFRFAAALGEELSREEIDLPGENHVRVIGRRATYRIGEGPPIDGLLSEIRIDCDMDVRPRVAIWVSPLPDGAVEEESLEGSVVDPREAAAFVSGLGICGPG